MKQLFHIDNDPGNQPVQPVLLLRIGSGFCCAAVTDPAASRLFRLSWIAAEGDSENLLEELLEKNGYLDQAFYEVRIAFASETATLLPLRQVVPAIGGAVLQTLAGVQPGMETISESVPEWQVQMVYPAPSETKAWLLKKFPSARTWHAHSATLKQLKSASGGTIFLDLSTDEFTVFVAAGGNLQLVQTYPYATPEDVLYYLLRIVSNTGLSQEEVQLSISGLLDHQSALFRELYQYFRHTGFRDAGWIIPGDQYPAHYFTTLNDLALCAS